jgi:carbon monoxide dehydrogenase subunit G
MASIHKEFTINASPDHVWSAIRDFGAVHRRLAKDFVVDTRLEGSKFSWTSTMTLAVLSTQSSRDN